MGIFVLENFLAIFQVNIFWFYLNVQYVITFLEEGQKSKFVAEETVQWQPCLCGSEIFPC